MNSIDKIIRTSTALLLAACLTTSCDNAIEESTATVNEAMVITTLKVDDFPAFEEENNNGQSTRSGNIGTYNPGKSAWEDGDEMLLKVTDPENNKVSTAIMTYKNRVWTLDTPIRAFFNNTILDYYYAPSFTWSDNEIVLKKGVKPGAYEYLHGSMFTHDVTCALLGFESRNYCRLRVATVPGAKITLESSCFIPAGMSYYYGKTFESTADKYGNAYFYGTWTENKKQQQLKGSGAPYSSGLQLKYFDFSGCEKGKSYAVESGMRMVSSTCYYQWDSDEPFNPSNIDYNYNKTLIAKNSCVNSPTEDQARMYINTGEVYWDEGLTTGDGYSSRNVQNYYIDGKVQHAGAWLLKKEYINGFDTNEAPKDEIKVIPKLGRPAENMIHRYFFLPASGYVAAYETRYYILGAGEEGNYWLSEAYKHKDGDDLGKVFFCSKGYVAVGSHQCYSKYLPMIIQ